MRCGLPSLVLLLFRVDCVGRNSIVHGSAALSSTCFVVQGIHFGPNELFFVRIWMLAELKFSQFIHCGLNYLGLLGMS